MEPIKYPRKRIIRHIYRLIGRAFAPILANIEISGQENLPKDGPLLVVGNHTGAMEVVLMTIYTPWLVEYLGSIDIPHEKFILFFIKTYGCIPIFRGKASKAAMNASLSVLNKNGIIGIFPEGGIWEPSIRTAHTGVAWLSFHAKSPILPVGFSSTQGALRQIFRLERPTLKMNIGQKLPPVEIIPNQPRKTQLQDSANRISEAIWELIPHEDNRPAKSIEAEEFEFQVSITDSSDKPIDIPPSFEIKHSHALSKFIHRRTLFNNLHINLNLPIHPLKELDRHQPVEKIITAAQSILYYLENENPYYFTYRYGQKEGSHFKEGIQTLHNLAVWVNSNQYQITCTPIRRYRLNGSNKEMIEKSPQEVNKW
ncbi:lysophospholipid acyltransferase family protein [Chloroflexota bacterium]